MSVAKFADLGVAFVQPTGENGPIDYHLSPASGKIVIESGGKITQNPLPTLTGAKAGNVALTNLVTLLAGLGLFTDSTT